MSNKRRAVLQYSTRMLHDLLLLPPDMRVMHVYPDNFGRTLAVVVKSPHIPNTLDNHLTELNPLYTYDDYTMRWKFVGFDENG